MYVQDYIRGFAGHSDVTACMYTGAHLGANSGEGTGGKGHSTDQTGPAPHPLPHQLMHCPQRGAAHLWAPGQAGGGP